MKRDEIKALFGDAITDEQLKALMDMNGADVNAAKASGNTAKSELAKAQERIAELEEQNMSAEDRLKQQLEAAEAARREFAIKSNTVDVKSKFVSAGIGEEHYAELLEKIVSDDAEKTNALADSVIALIGSQRNAAVEEAKKTLLSEMPKPKGNQAGSASEGLTKEQFDGMSYSERLSLFNDNPEVYKQLASD